MKTYTIIGTTAEAHASAKAAKNAIASADQEPKLTLRSQEDLAGADLGSKDLVAIWNALPGVQPVKKFTSRKVAVERIWKEVEALEPVAQSARTGKKAAEHRRRADKAAQGATGPKESKKATVLDLLRQPDGVTLDELIAATGWQAHSVRGFLSGTVRKKMGLEPNRFKRGDGTAAYRLSD